MTVRMLVGDCRDKLKTLPSESVHTICTSPPYWGLRDYQIPPSIWGGDPTCDHDFLPERVVGELRRGLGLAASAASTRGGGKKAATVNGIFAEHGFCRRCGAWRGAFGLEPSYQLYVRHAVEVFREVWRVLRRDGTLWLNLGDSYASGSGASGNRVDGGKHPTAGGRVVDWGYRSRAARNGEHAGKHTAITAQGAMMQPNRTAQQGLKTKDRCGIPWRVAFALQDDGWYLRQEIIYHKLNPMPESITDRPTTSHEQMFLLAKSGKPLLWHHRDGRWVDAKPEPDFIWRNRATRAETREPQANNRVWARINLWRGFDYYYDAEAIMELSSPDSHARAARGRSDGHKYADGGPGQQTIAVGSPVAGRMVERPTKAGWDTTVGEGGHGTIHKAGRNSREFVDHVPGPRKPGVTPKASLQPHKQDGPRPKQNESYSAALGFSDLVAMRNKRSVWSIATEPFSAAHFATFAPALIEPCILAGCPRGGTVLDPFAGAGTTGMVADRHQRDAILIEASQVYADMAIARINADAPPLFGAPAEAAE